MDTVDSQALRELEGVTRLGLGRQGTRGTSGQRLRLRLGGQARQVHEAGDDSSHRTTCPGVWSREAMWHIYGTAKHSGRQENTVGGHWGGQWEGKGGRGQGGLGSHAPAWQLDSILYMGQCQQVFRKDLGVKSSLAVVRWVGGRKKVRGTNPADRAFDARWTDRRMILGSDDDRRDEGERIHSKDIPGNSLAVRWFGLCSLLRAWVQSLFRN